MRKLSLVPVVLCALIPSGCGNGDTVWVTGMLQKEGAPYKAPEGHKLALYFYPVAGETDGSSPREVEMADYDDRDSRFSVPGRLGNGIIPGKYRVAVVETLRREALDDLNTRSKAKRGQKKIDDDQNLLEATFGEKTSPFIFDLITSSELTLDMVPSSK